MASGRGSGHGRVRSSMPAAGASNPRRFGGSVSGMGWLDRAKKLAEQAKELAEQAKDKAEEAVAEARARSASTGSGGGSNGGGRPPDERMGTPYVPGMLGIRGWREQGLPDPAAVLPIDDRDRAGIPHSTRSEIVEEPYGAGRRWTSGERSAGLFYRLSDAPLAWKPPAGSEPDPVPGGSMAVTLEDGRTLVLPEGGPAPVVVELKGLDAGPRADLVAAVRAKLTER